MSRVSIVQRLPARGESPGEPLLERLREIITERRLSLGVVEVRGTGAEDRCRLSETAPPRNRRPRRPAATGW